MALKKRWGKNKIPMHILVEEFLADNVAFRKDCYETLIHHREVCRHSDQSWSLPFAAPLENTSVCVPCANRSSSTGGRMAI